MNDSTAIYKKQLGLDTATFSRIDHDDTMIADVYRVTQPSTQPLILKICSSEKDYDRELYFLKFLAEILPTPRVVQVVEPKQGLAGAILMECLEGRLLQTEDWTDTLAYKIGSTLARLHHNRTPAYGDLTKPQEVNSSARIYFEQKFKEELAECAQHLPQKLVNQCQRYFDAQQHLLASVDGPCMIHRDFRPGNMIVFDGKLQGIIDWAGSRSGFAEQDFCPMEHRQWPIQHKHKKALLEGYASVRPLPNYQQIMPLLRLGRALAVVGFCVKSNTWKQKNVKLYQVNTRFLKSFDFTPKRS